LGMWQSNLQSSHTELNSKMCCKINFFLSRLVLVTITVTLITKNYNVSHQARNPKP